MVFGTLVGVFSVMRSELLMTSAISCPVWSSVYEYQRMECAFTSPVRTGCGMFVGSGVVSAGHVYGTRGSGIVSSAADVLWMSVLREMIGVGGVCEMCMCLARCGVDREGGAWIRGLGLGFTNPVVTGGMLGVCLCLGCGGVMVV